MEVLEIIMELWERCDKDREIRAIGVSLGEFKKTKVKQIALGENYDMDKKINLAKLKAEIRNKFGYKVIEETIDCEKEKGKEKECLRRPKGRGPFGNPIWECGCCGYEGAFPFPGLSLKWAILTLKYSTGMRRAPGAHKKSSGKPAKPSARPSEKLSLLPNKIHPPKRVSKGAAPLWPPEALQFLRPLQLSLLSALPEPWP